MARSTSTTRVIMILPTILLPMFPTPILREPILLPIRSRMATLPPKLLLPLTLLQHRIHFPLQLITVPPSMRTVRVMPFRCYSMMILVRMVQQIAIHLLSLTSPITEQHRLMITVRPTIPAMTLSYILPIQTLAVTTN